MLLETRLLLLLNRFFREPDLTRYQDLYSYARWQYGIAEQAYAVFYSHLVDFRGRRVVDIGCGDGGKTAFLAGLGPKSLLGIDNDPFKLEFAVKFAGQCEVCWSTGH